jgi:predicted O-methyltransferase YrrM
MSDDPTTLPRSPGIYGSIVGELGRHDIQVLADLARTSTRILEFGCGGSTLLFAQFAHHMARLISVDTEPSWMDKTEEKLKLLGADRVRFLEYDGWEHSVGHWPWFDLVFVDGLESKRLEFAETAWRMLQPGGTMAWHDGRWPQIVSMALTLVGRHFQQVDTVQLGVLRSNVLTIRKKVELPELNDPDKGRTEPWMSAHTELPKEWPFR